MSSQSPFPSPYVSMLLVGPDVPVRQIGQHREDEQEEEDGIADLDTLDQLRLGGPDEERGDVLGHLIDRRLGAVGIRSEEHTSELQSLMRISYAVFCLKKKNTVTNTQPHHTPTHNTQATIQQTPTRTLPQKRIIDV